MQADCKVAKRSRCGGPARIQRRSSSLGVRARFVPTPCGWIRTASKPTRCSFSPCHQTKPSSSSFVRSTRSMFSAISLRKKSDSSRCESSPNFSKRVAWIFAVKYAGFRKCARKRVCSDDRPVPGSGGVPYLSSAYSSNVLMNFFDVKLPTELNSFSARSSRSSSSGEKPGSSGCRRWNQPDKLKRDMVGCTTSSTLWNEWPGCTSKKLN